MGFLATLLVGVVLGWLDWPLRLLIAPGMIATLAGQAAPDGRPAHRYLRSWLALQMRAARRSLDTPVPGEGEVHVWAPRVWVAPDEHSPVLHHGRVRGPARLVFAHAVVAIPSRGRIVVRPAEGHKLRRGERVAEVIELGDGPGLGGAPVSFPLRYARGNILIGHGGASAGLYRLGMTSYPYLPAGEKWQLQRRLQRLAHTIAADFSLWRVNRAYPAEQYVRHTEGLLDARHQDRAGVAGVP